MNELKRTEHIILSALVDHWIAMRGPRGHSVGCECGGSDDGIHSCKSFEKWWYRAMALVKTTPPNQADIEWAEGVIRKHNSGTEES